MNSSHQQNYTVNITLDNLDFHYSDIASQRTQVLTDISLQIEEHEFIAIVGPTGSGKTTLIQHFTGLLRPTGGRVLINGEQIPEKGTRLSEIRRQIGLVFQFPERQLFEETVYADVAFGPRNLGLSAEAIEERVRTTLLLVELDYGKLRDRSPHRLSEGEKRRVAIAGILAMDPQVLVLDEPTACLDPRGVHCIENILLKLHEAGKTIIIISHNIDLVFRIAERVILLSEGRIKYDGGRVELIKANGLLREVGLELPRTIRFLQTKMGITSFTESMTLYTLSGIEELLKNSSE